MQTTQKKKKRRAEAEPTLAIVGRPNVGKSTLFNRMVGSRRSIVGDEPGITRDRIYGTADWNGRTIRVVDTGGIIPDDRDLIPSEIYAQARVALDEADAIMDTEFSTVEKNDTLTKRPLGKLQALTKSHRKCTKQWVNLRL